MDIPAKLKKFLTKGESLENEKQIIIDKLSAFMLQQKGHKGDIQHIKIYEEYFKRYAEDALVLEENKEKYSKLMAASQECKDISNEYNKILDKIKSYKEEMEAILDFLNKI